MTTIDLCKLYQDKAAIAYRDSLRFLNANDLIAAKELQNEIAVYATFSRDILIRKLI